MIPLLQDGLGVSPFAHTIHPSVPPQTLPACTPRKPKPFVCFFIYINNFFSRGHCACFSYILRQDIAKEVAGEVGTLVKGVHRAGLIRGVLGYWNKDEGQGEDDAQQS